LGEDEENGLAFFVFNLSEGFDV